MNSGIDISPTHWEHWQAACQSVGVPVSPPQQALFERFYTLLVDANRTTNLTRITAPEDFLARHLLDSLSIVPLLPQHAILADIGSGAGFPAIPIAIARPDIRVTAVESVGKKCRFIADAAEQLNLENLQVIHARSEDIARRSDARESCDIVTARAVAALPTLLELCLPLVKTGGLFLAMKGLSYVSELEAAGQALKTLGGELREVRAFEAPELAGSKVIVIEKTRPTPDAYPRAAGLPGKKPL